MEANNSNPNILVKKTRGRNNSNPNILVKKTRGRQKIEMKLIEKETDRVVTFSKRRTGIYKKINELVTLTGSEVGFLVFSPAGKPFSYGDPSFEDLALQYLGKQHKPRVSPNRVMYRHARIQELLWMHNKLTDSMEEEEMKKEALEANLAGKPMNNWWNKDLNEMEVEELSGLEAAYSEVLMKVEKRRIGLAPNNIVQQQHPSSANGFPPVEAFNYASN